MPGAEKIQISEIIIFFNQKGTKDEHKWIVVSAISETNNRTG